MKRKSKWLALALGLALLFSACGGSSNGGAKSAPENYSVDSAASDTGWAEAEAEMPAEAQGTTDNTAAIDQRKNVKLIFSASLSLQTREFEKVVGAVEQIAAQSGGYIERSEQYGQAGGRQASYVLRVPREQYDKTLEQIGQAAQVVRQSRGVEDITEQYADTETRLATARTKHERLLALLAEAQNMQDIITLQDRLVDLELEIDRLGGEIRKYDSLVSFSTIEVNIDEVENEVALAGQNSFGARFVAALQNGGAGFVSLVQFGLLVLALLWPLLLLAAVVVLIVLWVRRRKK